MAISMRIPQATEDHGLRAAALPNRVKTTLLGALSFGSIVLVGSGFSTTAHADDADNFQFQSPSGNIACSLGPVAEGAAGGAVGCDIGEHTYTPPPKPQNCHLAWGDRFGLDQGSPVRFHCHGDTMRSADLPTLNYGETASSGSIRCDVEETGVTCTDNSTGHFFFVSRGSYQLG